jgi:hypothetical protein
MPNRRIGRSSYGRINDIRAAVTIAGSHETRCDVVAEERDVDGVGAVSNGQRAWELSPA